MKVHLTSQEHGAVPNPAATAGMSGETAEAIQFIKSCFESLRATPYRRERNQSIAELDALEKRRLELECARLELECAKLVREAERDSEKGGFGEAYVDEKPIGDKAPDTE